jgi:hypothetical protein
VNAKAAALQASAFSMVEVSQRKRRVDQLGHCPSENNNASDKVMEKLASGLRMDRAGGDASGLAVWQAGFCISDAFSINAFVRSPHSQ